MIKLALIILTFNLSFANDSVKTCDSLEHVIGVTISITSKYCSPYLEETDSTIVKVYPNCNTITFQCLRCKAIVTRKEEEKRVVIFRKFKNKLRK